MAQTDFSSLTGLQKKLWSSLVWGAGRDSSFWMGTGGLMGKGTSDSTRPVHLVTELTETERGNRCVMPLVQDLDGDGVVGDNLLEGNEEALVADEIEIELDQLRNGVRNKGRMSEQKTVIRFRVQAKDKLAFWKSEKIDEMLFLMASGVSFANKLDGSSRSATSQLPNLAFASDVSAPSTNRVIYAGDATSTATLTTSDKMSWNLLINAKARAKRYRLKPIRHNKEQTYIVVISPEQARDLQTDNDYKAAVAQAAPRSKSNDLFTGALAMVGGLVIYEHSKVYNTLGLTSSNKWGSAGTVDGAQALLLGAQALGFAKIGDGSWGESDNTDYQNRKGISYGCILGMIKAKFKSRYDSQASEDFSLLSIYTAAAAT